MNHNVITVYTLQLNYAESQGIRGIILLKQEFMIKE